MAVLPRVPVTECSQRPMDYEVETDGMDWCRHHKLYWQHLLSAGALTKYHCEHTRPYSTCEVVAEEDCKHSTQQVYEIGEPLRTVTYEAIRGTLAGIVRLRDAATGAIICHGSVFEGHGNPYIEEHNIKQVLRMLLYRYNCTLLGTPLHDLCAE